MRVFVASMKHESHSFCRSRTDIDAFRRRDYALGPAIPKRFRGTRTEWGAAFDAADEYGWELIHPLAAGAVPAGLVTSAAFDHLSEVILTGLKDATSIDGILLILHGAMIAEGYDDAESELLIRVRKLVGWGIPIAITLDMHANVTDEMARHCNILSTYRTTPHVDLYETGMRSARLLQRAMTGEVHPRVVVARRAMIDLDEGRTIGLNAPMPEILRIANQAENTIAGVLTVGVQAGYPWADIAQAGTSVAVTGDGYQARYIELAEQLMDECWKRRHISTIDLMPLDSAIAAIKAHQLKGGGAKIGEHGPLLVGDFTDCPAGGAGGDGTNLLKAMLDGGINDAVLGFVNDSAAVEAGKAAGVGAAISVKLGGKCDPDFGGGPLEVTGRVVHLSDGNYVRKGPMATGTSGSLGPTMTIEINGIRVVVCSHSYAVDDREQFRAAGIDPDHEHVLACKAMNHFRADFEPVSSGLIYVDSGGVCSTNYARFPYTKLRRPMSPIDFS